METGFKTYPASESKVRAHWIEFAALVAFAIVQIVYLKSQADEFCLGEGKGEEFAVCRAFYDYSEYFHGYR